MGRLDGKVAVISGAARGQGRSHAVTLAREGASIVAFDLCAGFEHVSTPPATEEDLQETVRLVEEHDQRCLAAKADARDLTALNDLAERTMDEFGRVDILAVNHGIWTLAANSWELEESSWQESIDVLLTGAWKVCKAFIPKIIAGERGGSIILTSSANGYTAQPSAVAYCAAKAGVINMMRVLAWECGEYWIRVNAVCPGGVETAMLLEGGTVERAAAMRPRYITNNRNLLPIEWQPPQSISDAVLWLASDEAKYVTGVALPVDSGWTTY
jgi:(+)-trans-carveol dehydrogenase